MALFYKITAVFSSIFFLTTIYAALPVTGLEARNPEIGSAVPFGAVVDRCVVPGTAALTFDDGPFIYTARLLDVLRDNGARATFFVNGHADGDVEAFAGVVQRALAEGHQIGSHT